MKKYYEIGKYKVFLTKSVYNTTGNTAINAICLDKIPYGTLTVNLIPLEHKELAYLNINLFGLDVEKFIVENGLGKKIDGRECQSGYLVYPLFKLNLEKI